MAPESETNAAGRLRPTPVLLVKVSKAKRVLAPDSVMLTDPVGGPPVPNKVPTGRAELRVAIELNL